MRKGNKTLAFLLALIMASAFMPLLAPPAQASTALQLQNQINNIAGLTATAAGNIVTVTGNAVAASEITLNMDPGVTVNWAANYSGSLSARNILVLQGAGTFNLTGIINNIASGAIRIAGVGTTLNIDGGSLQTSGTGVTLNISASNVSVSVNPGGTVNNAGTNSAINIGSGLTDVKIDINGGAVTSFPNGNAINDSGANTEIRVRNRGSVTTGSASAIRSTGGSMASVTIDNGTVTNAGTVAVNATIHMTETSNSQVTVTGASVVQNTHTPTGSQASFAIQTGGSVTVEGSALVTAYSRAINLVGMNSVATVNGGRVTATGAGTNCFAISTATDNPASAANAKIFVTGGWVSATAGNAIHVTVASAEVEVSGGWVTATTGRAINAIPAASAASVTVKGGFVFAYGTTVKDVINSNNTHIYYTMTAPPGPDNAMVITWDRKPNATVPIVYLSQTREDLLNWGGSMGYMWQNHPASGGGIFYSNGANTGFFPLSDVEVYTDYGLTFEGAAMYRDVNGNGEVDLPSDVGFAYGGFSTPLKYVLAGSKITLHDFRWNTDRQYALTVRNDATIMLGGSNMFASVGSVGSPAGQSGSYGIHILAPSVTLTLGGHGTLEAKGNEGAFKMSDPNQLILPTAYIYWTNDTPSDPGGPGTVYIAGVSPYNTAPYTYNPADKYVKISTLPFAVVSDQTISGTVGTALVPPQTATITLYGGVTLSRDLISEPASTWFKNLPAGVTVTADGAIGGTTITLTFSGTPLVGSQAEFDITIPMGELTFPPPPDMDPSTYADLPVVPNPQARFAIGAEYTLIVVPLEGGTVAVPGSSPITYTYIGDTYFGTCARGTPITVTAAALQDYHFTGWTPIGIDISPDTANPATFSMPPNTVMLTANFEKNSYTLTVVNGTGGGAYASGTAVNIAANAPPAGKVFHRWESDNGGAFANAADAATVFTMPAGDVQVTATYRAMSAIPRTGDDSDVLGWAAALLAYALALMALCILAWRKGALSNRRPL